MEKKFMMPANYNVMNDEEMTYTYGGDAVSAYLTGYYAVGTIGAILSIGNMIWGINESRNWIQANKKEGQNVTDLARKGIDDVLTYMGQSVGNAIVGIYTTLNLVSWWPVTAIAWLTA